MSQAFRVDVKRFEQRGNGGVFLLALGLDAGIKADVH